MPSQRLVGFDCLKVAAAYGVVVIHGLGEIPKTYWASTFSSFFVQFSVPVFLMMAFYFGISSLYNSDWRKYLFNRFKRLLVPFYLWSTIYLLARLLKQVLLKDESLGKLLADPISLLLGSAGVQLYFLPLLFTGMVAAVFITRWVRPDPFWVPFCLLMGSLCLSTPLQMNGGLLDAQQIMAVTQSFILVNCYSLLLRLGRSQQIAEGFVIVVVWVLYCLPYICVSILFLNSEVRSLLTRYTNSRSVAIVGISLTLTLILIVFFGFHWLRFLVPVLALLIGVLSSKMLRQRLIWIERFSYLSFGIYLVHGLLTAGLSPILIRLNFMASTMKLSLPGLLIISTLIFCLSALITALIARHKQAAQLLFGI
ncbi:acyltransferase family protein [Leptolyngbya sp. FACHB-17]|uniref:acyltransferase family protein n=1 Tax=unclassified Leptolyngbya TaxID=2650499 RepID=UPI00168099F3|nr:acyltransferase family protein [Leptolyngbya sp. FACHB-17]MBD2081723.1 acyltransferase family protein [Leptolyngbya sp. FACHB-17]